MSRTMLDDHGWSRLAPILKTLRIHYSERKLRLFIEAVLHKMRTGCPWRDLPKKFGSHSTVFNKFNRWSEKGHWRKTFEALREVDPEWTFLDSTACCAHTQASRISDANEQAIGKSVGGNTTKIHALCDANGNLIDFVLTGGNVHDSKVAPELIEKHDLECFVADKAYHSSKIRDVLKKKGTPPVVRKVVA